MVHEDGDEEDLEEAEVASAIKLYKEETGQHDKVHQVSKSGRRHTAINAAQLLGSRKRSKTS